MWMYEPWRMRPKLLLQNNSIPKKNVKQRSLKYSYKRWVLSILCGPLQCTYSVCIGAHVHTRCVGTRFEYQLYLLMIINKPSRRLSSADGVSRIRVNFFFRDIFDSPPRVVRDSKKKFVSAAGVDAVLKLINFSTHTDYNRTTILLFNKKMAAAAVVESCNRRWSRRKKKSKIKIQKGARARALARSLACYTRSTRAYIMRWTAEKKVFKFW